MDMKAFRAKVRDVRDALKDKWPWLMSIENLEKGSTAGAITQADQDTAARCLVEGTHRLATEDEVVAHQTVEAAARKEAEDKANATKLFVEGVGNLFRPGQEPDPAKTAKGKAKE